MQALFTFVLGFVSPIFFFLSLLLFKDILLNFAFWQLENQRKTVHQAIYTAASETQFFLVLYTFIVIIALTAVLDKAFFELLLTSFFSISYSDLILG